MKKTSLILVLLLIAVYTFAQIPDWLWAKSAGGYDLDFCGIKHFVEWMTNQINNDRVRGAHAEFRKLFLKDIK